MSSFDEACAVELGGIQDLLPFLKEHIPNGHWVFTHKGTLSSFLQRSVGDVLFNTADGRLWAAELKVEASSRTDNFFLETWSNRAFGMQKQGWIYTMRADLLWYYFADAQRFYTIVTRRLFDWAHGSHEQKARLYDFPEKEQKKYRQANATCGRCVPIAVIEREVGCNRYDLTPAQGQQITGAPRGPLPPHAIGPLSADPYSQW